MLFDPDTNKEVRSIAVGKQPHWAALSPDGKTAYVTNEGSNDMSVVDLESGKVTTVAVGQGPRKLVVQGGAKRSADAGGGAKVSIANFAFNPGSITIHPGERVTWSNDDGSPHALVFNGWRRRHSVALSWAKLYPHLCQSWDVRLFVLVPPLHDRQGGGRLTFVVMPPRHPSSANLADAGRLAREACDRLECGRPDRSNTASPRCSCRTSTMPSGLPDGSRAAAPTQRTSCRRRLCRAFKGIRTFSGGNARAWALTIVRNTSYTLARQEPSLDGGVDRGSGPARA